MKLEIDFYSRDQVCVEIQSGAADVKALEQLCLAYQEVDKASIVLLEYEKLLEQWFFVWFTLRQFHNLGHNVAVDTFAGLLLWDAAVFELLKDQPVIPHALELLVKASLATSDEEIDSQHETISARRALEDNPLVEIVNWDYLSKIPKIVQYRGKPGDKRFLATLQFDWKGIPSFLLHPKGFGFLGREINHYAPQSIVTLLRFLGKKHSADPLYLVHLSCVSHYCGKAHMLNALATTDEGQLASGIAFGAGEMVAQKILHEKEPPGSR